MQQHLPAAPSPDAVPPAPRAPSPRARELVFRYQAGQSVLLLIGWIVAAIGLLLSAVFCWGIPGDLRLSAGGRRAQGVVVAAQLDEDMTINGQHPTRIRFRYTVDGLERESESSTRNEAVIQAATPEAVLPIELLPGSPEVARLEGTTRSFFGVGGLLMLLVPGLGLAFVGAAVRSHRRELRAFVHGEPVQAKVTSSGFDRTTQLGGRNPYKVSWEFLAGGLFHTGSISSTDPRGLGLYQKGQLIVVLYDRCDPSANALWVE